MENEGYLQQYEKVLKYIVESGFFLPFDFDDLLKLEVIKSTLKHSI